MSFYVRHRTIPIKFLEMAGKEVASQVPVNMATVYETLDEALDRAHKQFGDEGLEHIEICTAGAAYPQGREKRTAAPKRTHSVLPTQQQTELL